MVLASRAEALTAVELHNSPVTTCPLESYLVHMHIAWLYLLHASFEKSGSNYFYRDAKTGRYLKVDGERKTWELERCASARWADPNDPVRANLELTIKLRNKIEHRYERGLMVAAYGFTQALMINYDAELVAISGPRYSVADRVHLPVSLSTFSREGAAALAAAQAQLPKRLRDFFIDYRARLTEEVRSDRSFEFRIEILQKRAPKSEADLAISFVREEDLEPEEVDAYRELERTGRVILREKHRDVANVGWMKPSAAARQIQERLGYRFLPSAEFPKAWQHFGVRPGTNVPMSQRARTKNEYCRYDEAHDDYLYSGVFVELVVEACASTEGFESVLGWSPKTLLKT